MVVVVVVVVAVAVESILDSVIHKDVSTTKDFVEFASSCVFICSFIVVEIGTFAPASCYCRSCLALRDW